ncbi:hypothetical protein L4D76_00505 [Photobacterium sagamiensis]|uniref:hypothetical protein n=1 Tax=Photobacterium sagamiensis TaxID=2910241 RepID=UPI003D0CCB9E
MSFSIFNNPFSDETMKLRRNCLLSTTVCLFVGLTETLPSKIALLGISFESNQQSIVGWFLFVLSLYTFLHFVSVAAVELAHWIKPFLVELETKKELLKHPGYDPVDFAYFNEPPQNSQDLNEVSAYTRKQAEIHINRKMAILFRWVYLKLVIEIIIPVIIGIWGLVMVAILIMAN